MGASDAFGIAFVVLVAALATAVGYWLWLENEDAAVHPGIVVSTGVLSASEYPVSAPHDGVVASLTTAANQTVTVGAALAVLRYDDGSEHPIAAAHAGRVEAYAVKPGDSVTVGQVIGRIADMSALTLAAPFSTVKADAVPIGAEARLLFREFSDTPIKAKVLTVVAADGGTEPRNADSRTETITVAVTDTRSMPLTPGLRGRVYIRVLEGAPWPAQIR